MVRSDGTVTIDNTWVGRLNSSNRTHWKMKRVDLAIRFVHLHLCLEQEQSVFADRAIRPAGNGAAWEALLKAVRAGRLKNLDHPDTREALWKVLGASHPLLRLYTEGVRTAGYLEDVDVNCAKHSCSSATNPAEACELNKVARTIVRSGGFPLDDWFVTALANLLAVPSRRCRGGLRSNPAGPR